MYDNLLKYLLPIISNVVSIISGVMAIITFLFVVIKFHYLIENLELLKYVMKVDKEMVKNNVKRMAIVGIAAVAGISLFACKKAEAPVPKADIRIDVDANLSDGNKINEKEVKTQINNGNNGAKEGVNKTDGNTNNSVNKGKNGENIENDTNNSNKKAEETKVGAINVGSIDINTSKTYDNTAEIEAQSKASLNKGLPTNSYGYTKEDIDKMQIPQEMLDLSGNTEKEIKNTLKRTDYLWEYMQDPANAKVDYSLSDEEFYKKYGDIKEMNGHKRHIRGIPYTFGADGFPIEHPGDDAEITNPYNGKTYIFKERYDEWEDKDNPIPRRKATEEELNEIAAAYSASFK